MWQKSFHYDRITLSSKTYQRPFPIYLMRVSYQIHSRDYRTHASTLTDSIYLKYLFTTLSLQTYNMSLLWRWLFGTICMLAHRKYGLNTVRRYTCTKMGSTLSVPIWQSFALFTTDWWWRSQCHAVQVSAFVKPVKASKQKPWGKCSRFLQARCPYCHSTHSLSLNPQCQSTERTAG